MKQKNDIKNGPPLPGKEKDDGPVDCGRTPKSTGDND
jgi:hypothetical protein